MGMSFPSSLILRSVAGFAAASCVATSAANAALLLDFGPTVVTNASPDFDATVSPAHSAGAIPTSTATWNTIQTADVTSGLLYGDGTAATGVSVDLGATSSGFVVPFSTQPASSSALGSQINQGVYSGTRVAKDGIFHSGSLIGIQVTGLGAGEYSVYITGRNTNAGTTSASQRLYGAVGPAATSFNFTAITNTADFSNNTINSANSEFTQGVQYNVVSVDLAAGQALFIGVDAIGSGESRPFVNSIEIVLVPEPASLSLLAMAGGAMLRRRRD